MAWLALLLLAAPDFTNVAEEIGLAGVSSGRAVFVDLNGDGRMDVVLDREHFFLQQENGQFAPTANLGEKPGLVLFADYDNDGDQDCFAAYFCEPENKDWVEKSDKGQKNAVFWNERGTWRRGKEFDLRTSMHSATTLDYDKDGRLDLFLGEGYIVYGPELESWPDHLYRQGKKGFADVTAQTHLDTARAPGQRGSAKPTYGVTHADWNNDGWQDLFVCTYGRQWNFLWKNLEGKRFEDVAETTAFDGDTVRHGRYPDATKTWWKKRFDEDREDEQPFRSNGNTFDCAIADYDNDGDLDCILAEITHAWAGDSSDRTSLLVNLGPQKGFAFERVDAFPRERKGDRWNQGDIHAAWIDYDNDGLLDALIASSDYPDRQELKLYRQKPDHTFEPARTFDWEGAAQLSVADYDNDGDQDILIGRSLNRLLKEPREKLGLSCALFRNDVGSKNHWLQVVCVGKDANRDGIGCRIEVTTADGVTQLREIRGGHGHAGHNDPYIAHFGLGTHEKAKKIVVRWPDRGGSITEILDSAVDQRLNVRQ
ncbi:MAG: CRTAC1 family protein [Planctomycetota bacterium]